MTRIRKIHSEVVTTPLLGKDYIFSTYNSQRLFLEVGFQITSEELYNGFE